MRAADADPRPYLEGANRAFGTWGDEATFRWVFRGDSELLLVEDEGRIIAGTGIVRRTLVTGDQVVLQCGSWTDPDARGRGAFTRMSEEVRRVGILMAFVRGENTSRRVLERMGAALHPAFYCRSLPGGGGAQAFHPAPQLFRSSFLYTPEEWRTQFLERPHAQIECLDGAIVERAADFDRVHTVTDERLLPLLAARAHAAGRRLFWYTTHPPSMPCEWTSGFVATMPRLAVDWNLQNGDRV